MEIKAIFGENLKFYRKAKRLSQEELSEIVDISVKHLSSIERGQTFVSSDLLDKLAASINVPVYYLFVNQREIVYNDHMLGTIDNIVEKKLINAIDEIKSEIRRNN